MISFVVAATRNNVIGRSGTMPWRLKADMQHFTKTTLGKPVVMGRKTYDSIGRPLKGRRNIIVTQDQSLSIAGCEMMHSMEDVLALAEVEPEVMVIGGAQLFNRLLPYAERIYFTRIDCTIEGDTFFPELSLGQWHTGDSVHHDADECNDYPVDIMELNRVLVENQDNVTYTNEI